jgi:3-oxoacyl-[acyl-carrier-protein] synthase-3
MRRSIIKSCGGYQPEKIVTNNDLEKIVDTSDEWIQQRTGIKERRIAADDETTADMAIEAARNALNNGSISPDEIDMVIVATSTPDRTFPAVAVKVQAELGIGQCPAFDLQAVCSGFVYGMSVADSLIKTGQASRVLLIGAEKMSALINWEDRSTCVLFGDGAGAVILEAVEDDSGAADSQGLIDSVIYADGLLRDILHTSGGTSTTGISGDIIMDGREVFRNAVQLMSDVVLELFERNKVDISDIDWLVPHQANNRIIEAIAKKIDFDTEKIIMTVSTHGNTSAASIPLALCAAIEDGRIKRGDMLLMNALGAGLAWGAVLLRF